MPTKKTCKKPTTLLFHEFPDRCTGVLRMTIIALYTVSTKSSVDTSDVQGGRLGHCRGFSSITLDWHKQEKRVRII